MPLVEEFTVLCLVLARFDLKTPVSVVMRSHRASKGVGLPFGPKNSDDFNYLVNNLLEGVREQSGGKARQPEEYLADVVPAALKFSFARAGDTDIGWYGPRPDETERPEKAALKDILSSADSADPAKLRESVRGIYPNANFDL